MTDWLDRTHLGDCRELMRQMIGAGVRAQCVVTSPPYWGLRDYGIAGQFGLERTWVRHVARMRAVFRLVRQVLEDDGVLWLNYGDSYYTPRVGGGVGENSTINGQGSQEAFRDAQRARRSSGQQSNLASATRSAANRRRDAGSGLKPKDLVGMPWRIALALQADGWWLRSDVIWQKPNPMPESIQDRPTKAHEYLFLLARSELYYYDAEAVKEAVTGGAHPRGGGVNPKARPKHAGWADGEASHATKDHARARQDLKRSTKFGRAPGWRQKQNASFSAAVTGLVTRRNLRTIWNLPTQPFKGAHFATFPEALVARCILAGSRPGDVVFDPFMGSGTVAKVASELGRRFVGCELNPEYVAMQRERSVLRGLQLT